MSAAQNGGKHTKAQGVGPGRYPSMEPHAEPVVPQPRKDRHGRVPGPEIVGQLWDRYAMPPHIRDHSRAVARVAVFLAREAAGRGMAVDPNEVEVSALLHDLAKGYTIAHGGNHSQLGAAWVMQETGNALIAQGVMHHVYWPWRVDAVSFFLPLAVLYADKRVRHKECVTLTDRFTDLMERYGRNEAIRERIELSRVQAVSVEQSFNELLEMELNACPFTGGGLVG